MSEPDDITQALLEGTLGIGEHGIAEPLEGEERERARLRMNALICEEIRRARQLIERGVAGGRATGVLSTDPIIVRMMDCDFSQIVEEPQPGEPLGYIDEDGAWRPKRLRPQIRAGARLAVGPDGYVRNARADERRFIGHAISDSRPVPDSDEHFVEVRVGGPGDTPIRFPSR